MITDEISTSLEDWFMAATYQPTLEEEIERELRAMPRIVGCDLSLTGTGIACSLDRVKVLDTPAKKYDGMRRLAYIRDAVLGCALVPRADCVLIEGYSFASHAGGERLGELGGVVRLALFEQGVPFLEVAPGTLKKFAAGRGNAKKPEMISAARERLGMQGHDDNAADALWLWALGMEGFGAGVVQLPKSHMEAVGKISWPVRR